MCTTKPYRLVFVDNTVVEADIHYPTDSGLLYDSIKALLQATKKCCDPGLAAGETTRNFTRSTKKQLLLFFKLNKDFRMAPFSYNSSGWVLLSFGKRRFYNRALSVRFQVVPGNFSHPFSRFILPVFKKKRTRD